MSARADIPIHLFHIVTLYLNFDVNPSSILEDLVADVSLECGLSATHGWIMTE